MAGGEGREGREGGEREEGQCLPVAYLFFLPYPPNPLRGATYCIPTLALALGNLLLPENI